MILVSIWLKFKKQFPFISYRCCLQAIGGNVGLLLTTPEKLELDQMATTSVTSGQTTSSQVNAGNVEYVQNGGTAAGQTNYGTRYVQSGE